MFLQDLIPKSLQSIIKKEGDMRPLHVVPTMLRIRRAVALLGENDFNTTIHLPTSGRIVGSNR